LNWLSLGIGTLPGPAGSAAHGQPPCCVAQQRLLTSHAPLSHRLAVHHDSPDADANTRFFLKHALHDRADFIFILNGESELRDEFPDHLPNVQVIQRDNSCYDLGAHGEVLKADNRDLVRKYDKFILMNGQSLAGTPCYVCGNRAEADW